jgi:hypothetical protein
VITSSARFHELAGLLLEEPDPDHAPVEVVDDVGRQT